MSDDYRAIEDVKLIRRLERLTRSWLCRRARRARGRASDSTQP